MRGDDAVIAAVSSPPGRSPRGIVRVSGGDLSALLDVLFDRRPPPRELTALRWRLDDRLDLPCLAAFFPTPHSYTGEDVLEVQTPGNPALLDRILHRVIDAAESVGQPARLAEPGEFTRRAFLAGRVALTECEGIAATIGAESDAQLNAAGLLRRGRLGSLAVDLVQQLARALALVEAGIDFVDQDDVHPIAPAELDRQLREIESKLQALLARSRSWSALEALPWVVLAGPPNAGKSTLFNALLGRERAVVSDIPGTTRDVLREPLRIETDEGAAEVMLVDVAGHDRPVDELNAAMQSAAEEALAHAELVIHLAEAGSPVESLATAAPVLRVRGKADRANAAGVASPGEPIAVSAITGQGLDELKGEIARRLRTRAVSLGGQMLALQPRHADELRRALAAVSTTLAMIADQLHDETLTDMELIASQMRLALDHLAALGGEMPPDDVLGQVFATFCVGK